MASHWTSQPDSFCAYDPPVPSGRRPAETPALDSTPVYSGSSTSTMQPRSRQAVPYAPPGSTSSSINPASTVAFMLNMGYPPPPIALEPLRRLLEQMTQGPGQILNLQLALHVTDEVSRSPYRIAPAVLFVIQQRLHSSKADRVGLALELLDMCVKNCGLDFVRHINKEFMKSMVSVIKTTSFKERTITGQMKKLEKYLIGSPSSTSIPTDPRVHKMKRQCLSMIQNWSDAFMMHPSSVHPILEVYKSLRRKGVQFPPRDTSQRYLVKHAQDSPAYVNVPRSDTSVSVGAKIDGQHAFDHLILGGAEGFNLINSIGENDSLSENDSCSHPFSEQQFAQLEKLINLLRTSDNPSTVEKALDMCEHLRPRLEEALRILTTQINSAQIKKLRGSDPRVAHLNAILDLDSEVKKRKGVRLIYSGGAPPLDLSNTGTNFDARELEEDTEKTNIGDGANKHTVVNLLDDLLDDQMNGKQSNAHTTITKAISQPSLLHGVAERKEASIPLTADFWGSSQGDFVALNEDPFAKLETGTRMEHYFERERDKICSDSCKEVGEQGKTSLCSMPGTDSPDSKTIHEGSSRDERQLSSDSFFDRPGNCFESPSLEAESRTSSNVRNESTLRSSTKNEFKYNASTSNEAKQIPKASTEILTLSANVRQPSSTCIQLQLLQNELSTQSSQHKHSPPAPESLQGEIEVGVPTNQPRSRTWSNHEDIAPQKCDIIKKPTFPDAQASVEEDSDNDFKSVEDKISDKTSPRDLELATESIDNVDQYLGSLIRKEQDTWQGNEEIFNQLQKGNNALADMDTLV